MSLWAQLAQHPFWGDVSPAQELDYVEQLRHAQPRRWPDPVLCASVYESRLVL
jgi:hypothetical protein